MLSPFFTTASTMVGCLSIVTRSPHLVGRLSVATGSLHVELGIALAADLLAAVLLWCGAMHVAHDEASLGRTCGRRESPRPRDAIEPRTSEPVARGALRRLTGAACARRRPEHRPDDVERAHDAAGAPAELRVRHGFQLVAQPRETRREAVLSRGAATGIQGPDFGNQRASPCLHRATFVDHVHPSALLRSETSEPTVS